MRRVCREELTSVLAREGFTTKYANMMSYGCLNPRKRLIGYLNHATK
ncbi:hypothetical protein [Vulcanisaeta sp. JCM 14467]|nr:hypothetical protein [Vulcanisaeta sp. JCM 14467]